MNGREFLGRFDGLRQFLLCCVHFGLNRAHLRINGVTNIGDRLSERAEGAAEPFAQGLHISGGHSRLLCGFGFHRSLLRLDASDRVLVHDRRWTFRRRFLLGPRGKRRILRTHHRSRNGGSFFHRERLLTLPG